MANTYTQLYMQFVFAVKGRRSFVLPHFREELEKYMCGISSNYQSKVLAIYCNPDHAHLLISMPATVSPSFLMDKVKGSSSKWVNRMGFLPQPFNWQDGFGVFSYSKTAIPTVAQYIHNQPKHHQKVTFREEYPSMLTEHGVEFDPKYLFEFYD